jgi:hypothetical protein
MSNSCARIICNKRSGSRLLRNWFVASQFTGTGLALTSITLYGKYDCLELLGKQKAMSEGVLFSHLSPHSLYDTQYRYKSIPLDPALPALWSYPPFEFFSCSMICLLQLQGISTVPQFPIFWRNLLSTWKESALLRELCPHLSFRTQLPHHRRNTKNNHPKNRRVCFPVRGLRVPATCWWPDVLGVSSFIRLSWNEADPEELTYGILPPPPWELLATLIFT